MTISDIEERAMFQTGNDAEDLTDYKPYVTQYVSEGLTLLYSAYTDSLGALEATDSNLTKIPEWAHPAVADYATYCLYRNGSSAKQGRGQAFLNSFYQMKTRVIAARSGDDRKKFINIPW